MGASVDLANMTMHQEQQERSSSASSKISKTAQKANVLSRGKGTILQKHNSTNGNKSSSLQGK